MLHKASKGGQSAVSRRRAVPSLGFHVIQEGEDCRWLNVVQAQFGDRPACAVGEEAEEELERVPVSADRMLTRATNATQVVLKESLDETQKPVSLRFAHRFALFCSLGRKYRRRNRSAASPNSSGVAVK